MNPVRAKESYETLRKTLSGVTYGPIVEVPRAEQYDYTGYIAPDNIALLINLDEKALLAAHPIERPLYAKAGDAASEVVSALRALYPGKTFFSNSGLFRKNRHGEKDCSPFLVVTCPRSVAAEVESLLEKARYGEPFLDKPYSPTYTKAQKERVSYITSQLNGHVIGACSAIPRDKAKTYVTLLGGDETFLTINLDGKSILKNSNLIHPDDQRWRIRRYVDNIGGDIQELIGQIFPDTYLHHECGFHKHNPGSGLIEDVHQPYIGFICRTAYAPHIQQAIEDLLEQSRMRAASAGYTR